MVSLPKNVSERLSQGITTYKRILKKADKRKVDRADTVAIVTGMLSKVFGFAESSEVADQWIPGDDCRELAALSGTTIVYLVKVLAPGLPLTDRSLKAVAHLAAKEGIAWVVQTNGPEWRIFRIRSKERVSWQLVYHFNVLSLSGRRQEDKVKLFALCRESAAEGLIGLFHEQSKYVNRFVISDILCSEAVTSVVWRILRKISPDTEIDLADIETVIRREIVGEEILASQRVKLARKAVHKALKK